MATVNISFNIPDAVLPDYRSALQYRYGRNPDGTVRTDAQLQALLKADLTAQIESYYRQWKKNTAKPSLGVS
jgi:hypothetical protein